MTIAGSWSTSNTGRGGLLLARVFGVPILLALSWWIFAAVVVLLYTLLVGLFLPVSPLWVNVLLAACFAVLLGISVLLHELGHCLMALRLGLPVRRVRLQMLGGVSEVVRTPATPAQEGMVAAAGPAVSVLLTALLGLGLVLTPAATVVWVLVLQATIANGVVARGCRWTVVASCAPWCGARPGTAGPGPGPQ